MPHVSTDLLTNYYYFNETRYNIFRKETKNKWVSTMEETLKRFKFLLISALIFIPSLSLSGPATDRLSVCLAVKTSYVDKLNLVRWIMVAYGAHPAAEDLMRPLTQNEQNGINQNVGVLIERLLIKDCSEEAKTALIIDGDTALEISFEVLGSSAATSLMADANVNESIMGFMKYVDLSEIERLMR